MSNSDQPMPPSGNSVRPPQRYRGGRPKGSLTNIPKGMREKIEYINERLEERGKGLLECAMEDPMWFHRYFTLALVPKDINVSTGATVSLQMDLSGGVAPVAPRPEIEKARMEARLELARAASEAGVAALEAESAATMDAIFEVVDGEEPGSLSDDVSAELGESPVEVDVTPVSVREPGLTGMTSLEWAEIGADDPRVAGLDIKNAESGSRVRMGLHLSDVISDPDGTHRVRTVHHERSNKVHVATRAAGDVTGSLLDHVYED